MDNHPQLDGAWAGGGVRRWVVGVGLVGFAAALLAVPARATVGERTTADEPQYLLSALSLWEDRDLDIGDELADERWRDFHEAPLPVQTEPLPDGRTLSPHDPLLPVLLAVPVGIAGWAGAKVFLAALAGVLAALVAWTAHRRLRVPIATAGLVAGAVAVCSPLVAYGSQLYPELPAAVAVVAAFAAVTGSLDRRGQVGLVLAVVVLPWLAVKYVPVAAALALVGLVRLARQHGPGVAAAVRVAAAMAGAGVAYLVVHRALYGGWTVYAAGDHFAERGELSVTGYQPNLPGRSRRLLGLVVDRGFGLAAWAPVWLLAIPALAALARRRPPGWIALVAPLAAGWATATWVALTMHGWWWPGRQVVVVLPLAALALAWWVAALGAAARRAVVALAAFGALAWAWFVVEVLTGPERLIIDFEATSNPLVRGWRLLLPELRDPVVTDWLRYGAWAVALGAAAVAAWRHAGSAPAPTSIPPVPPMRSPNERTSHHVPA